MAACLLGCTAQPSAGTGDTYLTPAADVPPAELTDGRPLRLVATTNILADVVRQVAGPQAEVRALIPAGVDPHSFEPTPADVRALAQADLTFVNGFGLDAFVLDLITQAGRAPVIVSASESITPIEFAADTHAGGEAEPAAGGQAHEADEPSHDHDADPHVWLDPQNVSLWTTTVETALAARDPARAADVRRRAEAYRADLLALDAAIERQLAILPDHARLLVTDHDEFGYFARRYRFTIVGAVIPAASSMAEPSAQDVARLEQSIRDLGVRAVFVSTVVNPRLAQRVAGDTGIRLVNLHVHSLTVGGPADTYLDLMRGNAAAIAAALAP
jgi:ABC-type Zn uptake system ZnuABC Zn-binding protein ZnuA